MSVQFHFRNFTERNIWFGAYHAGCGGAPWHDGRPRCWPSPENFNHTIPHNPTGGYDSVYVPADWVVHFADWFKLIADSLKLVGDIGLFIASEGTDEDALVDAIKDVFNVTDDAVRSAAEYNSVDLSALAANASATFANSCASVGMTTDEVTQIGNQLGLGNWAFVGGSRYQSEIHDDSDLVSNFGWSVFVAEDGKPVNSIANHAFINQGHFIQVFDDATSTKLWNNWS
jgi:hypothetical protein